MYVRGGGSTVTDCHMSGRLRLDHRSRLSPLSSTMYGGSGTPVGSLTASFPLLSSMLRTYTPPAT